MRQPGLSCIGLLGESDPQASAAESGDGVPAHSGPREMHVLAALKTKPTSRADIAAMPSDAASGAQCPSLCRLRLSAGVERIDYGPALAGFTRNQTAEVATNAMVSPPADIFHPYRGTLSTSKDGTVVGGRELSTAYHRAAQSISGPKENHPAYRVRGRRPLRPPPLLTANQLGLTAPKVADLVTDQRTR